MPWVVCTWWGVICEPGLWLGIFCSKNIPCCPSKRRLPLPGVPTCVAATPFVRRVYAPRPPAHLPCLSVARVPLCARAPAAPGGLRAAQVPARAPSPPRAAAWSARACSGPGRAQPQLDPPAGAARGPRGRGRVAAGSNRSVPYRSVPSRAGGRVGSGTPAERRALRRRRRGERGPGRGAHLPVTATAEASIVPGRAARDAACTRPRPRAPGPGRPGRFVLGARGGRPPPAWGTERGCTEIAGGQGLPTGSHPPKVAAERKDGPDHSAEEPGFKATGRLSRGPRPGGHACWGWGLQKPLLELTGG